MALFYKPIYVIVSAKKLDVPFSLAYCNLLAYCFNRKFNIKTSILDMVFGTMAMDVTGEYGDVDITVVHTSDKTIPELNHKLYDVYTVDLIVPNSEVDPSYDCILIFSTDPKSIEKDITDVCNDIMQKFNKGVK